MKLFILFMFFINTGCHAQEIYDVETVPTLRTKSYSRGYYKNIVIFSAPRTGSSLIYNIFRFLFEEDSQLLVHHDSLNFDNANSLKLDRVVLKTHDFSKLDLMDKENTLCIFTFRNPIDTAVSHFRISMYNPTDAKFFAKEYLYNQYSYLFFSETKEQEGLSILRLRYEDFVNNLDYLFEIIENYFQLSIDSQDKELMKLSYSKKNIEACTKKLNDFNNYLPFSGFHGQHLRSQNYVPPENLLYWLNIYLKEVKPLFQTYGYFLDDSLSSASP